MMKTVSAVVFVAVAALAGGCGDGGIEGSLDELESINEETAGHLCGCYQQLGYATESACLAEGYQPMTASERECLVAALEQDTDASQEFLDCVTPRIRDMNTCVAAIDTCDDTFVDQVIACAEQEDAQLEACQALLPASVDTAADACFE